MKYQEAQDQSVSGVAVFGNEIMQDIIWPKDSPHPFMFMQDGYIPADPVKFAERDGWQPLHSPRSARPRVSPPKRIAEHHDPPRWWEFWKSNRG
jgi:hypothetical protein